MQDFGTIDSRGVEHLLFLNKAEEILKYLHEIGKYFTWEERRILENAAEIIARQVDQRKNSEEPRLKQVLENNGMPQ